MIKAFNNVTRGVGVVWLCSQVLVGCKTLTLQQEQTPDELHTEQVEAANQETAQLDTAAAPLPQYSESNGLFPKQEYDALGNKIPYRPKPNPYFIRTVAVSAEAEALFAEARQAVRDAQWQVALERLQRLTDSYPQLSGPWLLKGKVLEQQGNKEAAIADYAKAIEVNPDNVYAYVHQGLLYRQLGNFAAAEQAYLEVLDRWPDFPEAHLNLGILYDLYMNKVVEAQKHYESYLFLETANQREVAQVKQVEKWLTEVSRRTGIKDSFIDQPPAIPVPEVQSPALANASEPMNGVNPSALALQQGSDNERDEGNEKEDG